MKLRVDAQLPPALARLLGTLGQGAVAAREVGLRAADDGQIWQWTSFGIHRSGAAKRR